MCIICFASADAKLTFKCGLHSNLPVDISMFWYNSPIAIYHIAPGATNPTLPGTQRGKKMLAQTHTMAAVKAKAKALSVHLIKTRSSQEGGGISTDWKWFKIKNIVFAYASKYERFMTAMRCSRSLLINSCTSLSQKGQLYTEVFKLVSSLN